VRLSERAAAALIGGVGMLLYATPLRSLWAQPGSAWYLPFVLWALLIVAAAANARRGGR